MSDAQGKGDPVGAKGRFKLAIWNGVKPGRERRFELWHSHVHLIQKREMGILTSGSRHFAPAGQGRTYFTLYESPTADTFGPAGYAVPSPTGDLDRSVREDFVDFVRGVYVAALTAGNGKAGWIATVGLVPQRPEINRAAWSTAFAQFVGVDGIVAAELCTFDLGTTTSFVLRLDPKPTLPAAPWLLLLRGIDRDSIDAAVARLPVLMADNALACEVAPAQTFMLQHEFQA